MFFEIERVVKETDTANITTGHKQTYIPIKTYTFHLPK